MLSNFNRCKNEILETELLSRTIYKPCSPSAAPCSPWESGCNLVASIASFVCVRSKQWSEFLRFGRTVHGCRFTGSHSFIARDVREFRIGQKKSHGRRVL